MDTILKEIREHFAANRNGLRAINILPSETPAYTIRIGIEFGVAIEFDGNKDFYEESSNALMSTRIYSLQNDNTSKRFLALTCSDETYRNEFAELCTHFVEPGIDNLNREMLLEKPLNWWDQWIGLLGNRKGTSKCYDIIAEMMALDHLFQHDNTVIWAAEHAGSHDIESQQKSYEVKATLKKYETNVTISSQHQLYSENELFLMFFRLEKSEQGLSINNMKDILIGHGYDENLLESQLSQRGYMKGSSIRDQKYKLLEARLYKVDDDFPKIIESSFKNDVYPQNIVKILYTIDLEGLDYTPLHFE